jgi:hypothetical protein
VRTRDEGGVTLEYLGTVLVAVLLLAAVAVATLAHTDATSSRVTALVCRFLGGDGCGDGAPVDREPTTPCLRAGSADRVRGVVDVALLKLGGDRGLLVESLSDGTYRVRQVNGADASAGVAAGAALKLTVDNHKVGTGTVADVSAGLRVQTGAEWHVASQDELDAIVEAERWGRVEDAVVPRSWLPGVRAGRAALGLGPDLPPAHDRFFVSAGAVGEGSGFAGVVVVNADGTAKGTRLVGYAADVDGGSRSVFVESELTFKDEGGVLGLDPLPVVHGSARFARVRGVTEYVLDSEDRLVQVRRSSLAAGSAGGAAAAAFSDDWALDTQEKVKGGRQYEAVLDVRTAEDAQVAFALMRSEGVSPLPNVDMLLPDGVPTSFDDGAADDFMAAVRERGTLTSQDVTVDEHTALEGKAKVAVGLKAGLTAGYQTTRSAAAAHRYWDGGGWAARTTC